MKPLQVVPDAAETLEFTGERFIHGAGVEISYDHWTRYAFASQIAARKRTLDVASGEGYGAHYLSHTASHVTAFDVDARSVEHARKLYGRRNIAWQNASLQDFFAQATPASFELITAFEIVEHVGATEQEEMLKGIAAVLAPGGVAILSTPDKLRYAEARTEPNAFHVHELLREEFEALLGRHFKHVRLYQQKTITGSALVEDGATAASIRQIEWPHHSARLSEAVALQGHYLVAVASQEPLPELEGCVTVDASRRLVDEASHALRQELAELRQVARLSGGTGDRAQYALNAAVEVLAQKVAATREMQTARHRLEIENHKLRSEMESEGLHRRHIENMLSVRIAFLIKRQFDERPRFKEFTRRVLMRVVG